MIKIGHQQLGSLGSPWIFHLIYKDYIMGLFGWIFGYGNTAAPKAATQEEGKETALHEEIVEIPSVSTTDHADDKETVVVTFETTNDKQQHVKPPVDYTKKPSIPKGQPYTTKRVAEDYVWTVAANTFVEHDGVKDAENVTKGVDVKAIQEKLTSVLDTKYGKNKLQDLEELQKKPKEFESLLKSIHQDRVIEPKKEVLIETQKPLVSDPEEPTTVEQRQKRLLCNLYLQLDKQTHTKPGRIDNNPDVKAARENLKNTLRF
jgi:hypothetical protein